MIAKLTGRISEKTADRVIIDAQGVGYEVMASKTTLEKMPGPGTPASLLIYTHMTENTLALYGFYSAQEKELFKKLISVSGIGPRIAIQVLSGLNPGQLVDAICQENIALLTSINGVGRKTAERVIMELKDKVMDLYTGQSHVGGGLTSIPIDNTYEEALSALINLGYPRAVAQKALGSLRMESGMAVEKIIRDSLSLLGKQVAPDKAQATRDGSHS